MYTRLQLCYLFWEREKFMVENWILKHLHKTYFLFLSRLGRVWLQSLQDVFSTYGYKKTQNITLMFRQKSCKNKVREPRTFEQSIKRWITTKFLYFHANNHLAGHFLQLYLIKKKNFTYTVLFYRYEPCQGEATYDLHNRT